MVQIIDQPGEKCYVIELDGERVGRLDYRLGDEDITFTHAEIDADQEGRGLGSRLAGFALDDARARGLAVLPACPFVSDYVRRHPEYLELVPGPARPRYRL